MRARVAMAAVMGVVLSAVVAWAGQCPLCLQQIPDGEQFCLRHKQEQLTKTMTSTEEAKLIADLDQARAQYREKLETLKKFYSDRGNEKMLAIVEAEQRDYESGKHVGFTNWEDGLPTLAATNDNPDAAKLLAQADALKDKMSPFGKAQRLADAAVLYRNILTKYPTSKEVEPAAYALGDIYSGSGVAEYDRAVKFYELCYLSNPKTTRNALMRAAAVCEDDLGNRESAARYYWMAAQTAGSAYERKKAEVKLKALQKGGFGQSYQLPGEKQDEKQQASAAPAPAAAK